MKINVLILLLICFVQPSFAQPEDATIKIIEGKKYYIHTVEQGNTIYGIHALYKTEVKDILNANEGLTDNLIIGQQILIPINSDLKQSENIHIVKQGETLYGISKIYNCSVGDLKKLNSGIEAGIQIGQKLNIPGKEGEVIQTDPIIQPTTEYKISYTDSVVFHTVLAHETLYSISKRYMVSSDTIRSLNNLKGVKVKKGNVLKIPVKKVNYSVLAKEVEGVVEDTSVVQNKHSIKKESYTIALMLPFMLAKNDIEMNKILKFGQIRELNPTTKIAFEFYQGFKFAADSLKKAGVSLKILIYDTRKDTAAIAKIFAKEEFKSVDLVVGPLYPRTINYTAKKCQERGLNIVLPFKTDAKVLHENPFTFKAVTSNMTLLDGSVDYIVKEYKHHNVIILKPYLDSDKALYERAKGRFNNLISETNSYNVTIIETGLGSSGGRELNAYIKKYTVNIVIIPSNDIKFVAGAMNRLNKVMNLNPYAKKLKIIAFGFEDWNKFNDIDVLHRNRLNQHYSTYRFVDYNQTQGLNFVRAFRDNTGTDPTVYSSQGFDVGMYFLSALYAHGTSFQNSLDKHQMNLVQNDFRFQSISENSGYENTCVSVVKYESFELILCSE